MFSELNVGRLTGGGRESGESDKDSRSDEDSREEGGRHFRFRRQSNWSVYNELLLT